MSTDDKRGRQDETADGKATEKDVADTPRDVEDAEIVSETPPGDGTEESGASSVQAEPDMTKEEADAAVEEPVLDAQETPADAPEEPAAEAAADAPAEEPAEERAPVWEEPAPEEPAAEGPAAPAAAPAPAAAESGRHGGGVFSTIFGGVLAALVGFGAAQFVKVDWLSMTGVGKDPVAVELEALKTRLDELETENSSSVETAVGNVTGGIEGLVGDVSGQMESLSGELSSLQDVVHGDLEDVTTLLSSAQSQMETVATSLTNVDTRMGSFGERLGGLDERLAEVDQRLVAVEKRPLVESSDTAKAAFDSYERQLEELRTMLASQREDAGKLEDRLTDISAASAAELTAMQEEAQKDLASAQDAAAAQVAAAEERARAAEAAAEERANQAVAEAALAQVVAALNAGIPYETALPALQEVTEVPAVILDNGATGIPTVLELQESFTPAAREALEESLTSTMTDDPADRFMAFLRTQTGVRSLEAREGDDPDAVLSRMTVAVEEGDLAAALAEFDALPADGQAELSGWADQARARVDADAALPGLAAAVNTN
ncbi:hypothetical protein [Poseidonocella sp. HB161398]|uniref:hypothetical protein n=1 Tax=Poseidonocella sp. HB161398 TaxID=2320855 RepID=UPI001107B037|nr:hypothetical protein [Poseidonocella sp. HB161398]